MQKSSFDKWLVTLALAAVIAGVLWHFGKSHRVAHEQKPAPSALARVTSESGEGDFHPYYVPSVPRPARKQSKLGTGFETLPREKVEVWLAGHHRDAMSLLAAFHALGDTNYLNEAATNFPGNPQVELAVLARDEFPADRRKWLDLLKESSPSNSLANYLSAQDEFKNGHTNVAVQELLAAAAKSQFEGYAVKSELGEEELARYCGKSPVEAYQIALAGVAEEDLPEMAILKRLAQGIGGVQKHERAAGDAASVQNLAQMGMALGNQLIKDGGGKLVINQLVGIADEAIVLSQLDQNTRYDFLGGRTPSQVRQQNLAWKASVRELDANFQKAYPQLTENEKISYIERSQTYGELAAMRWLVQQHPPGNP